MNYLPALPSRTKRHLQPLGVQKKAAEAAFLVVRYELLICLTFGGSDVTYEVERQLQPIGQ